MTSSLDQAERRREAVLQQLAVMETEHQTILRLERKEREQEVDRLAAEKVYLHRSLLRSFFFHSRKLHLSRFKKIKGALNHHTVKV